MIRLTNRRGESLVVGSEDQAAIWAKVGYHPTEGKRSDDSKGYNGRKVEELKAEIERRNEGRDEADLLSGEGKKADLIAALEADDSATE